MARFACPKGRRFVQRRRAPGVAGSALGHGRLPRFPFGPKGRPFGRDCWRVEPKGTFCGYPFFSRLRHFLGELLNRSRSDCPRMIVAAVSVILLALAASPSRCDAQTPPVNPASTKVAPFEQPAKRKPLTPNQEERLGEAKRLNEKVLQLYQAGHPDKALPFAKQVLDIHQEVLGLEHESTVSSLKNLAAMHWAHGDYPQAERLSARYWRSERNSRGRSISIMPKA